VTVTALVAKQIVHCVVQKAIPCGTYPAVPDTLLAEDSSWAKWQISEVQSAIEVKQYP